jgi:hypothetical protein
MRTETTVAAQLAALPQIPMAELWKLWDEHFSRRPGTWNRDYVTSRVAFKIQERAFGGIDPDIKRKLLRLGESQSVFGKRRGSEMHLMPGTVLMRDWNEATHRVVVTPDGLYDLDGKVFKSLSAVARHITGTQWSGPAFFGVKRKMQGASGDHK